MVFSTQNLLNGVVNLTRSLDSKVHVTCLEIPDILLGGRVLRIFLWYKNCSHPGNFKDQNKVQNLEVPEERLRNRNFLPRGKTLLNIVFHVLTITNSSLCKIHSFSTI